MLAFLASKQKNREINTPGSSKQKDKSIFKRRRQEIIKFKAEINKIKTKRSTKNQ